MNINNRILMVLVIGDFIRNHINIQFYVFSFQFHYYLDRGNVKK